MDEITNLHEKYPEIDCYVDGAILSVNDAFRGQGIGLKLCSALVELCKKNNVPFIKVFCSSKFTAKICEKVGFKKTYEIPFRDIQLNDGLVAPDVPEPHSIARAYVGDLRA